jgi:antitoxin YefM
LLSGYYLAILLAMSSAEFVPLADVKNRLSEVVDRIQRAHGRVVITKHGAPAAILVSVEDLESLEETLEILSNSDLIADVKEAEGEIAKRRTKRLDKDEALALIKRR